MTNPLPLLLCAVLALSPVAAVEVSGRMIPDQATVGSTSVPLCGAALLKYKWVISLYVAGLYVPAGTAATPAAAVAAVPKRLLMNYARDIPREKMVEATDSTIGNGLTEAQLAALQPSLTAWNALYPAPLENDVLTFDHLPGGILIMSRNGTEIGRLTDEAFAQALFAIWIGKRPRCWTLAIKKARCASGVATVRVTQCAPTKRTRRGPQASLFTGQRRAQTRLQRALVGREAGIRRDD